MAPPHKAKRSLRSLAVYFLVTLLIGVASFGAGIYATSAPTTITIVPNSFVQPYTYTVWTDGVTISARDGLTGSIATSGTSATTVIQWCIDNLPATGGVILLKSGTYVLTAPVVMAPWPDAGNGTLMLVGEGMNATILKADTLFYMWGAYTGLLTTNKLGTYPKIPQVIVQDLTLDGNYEGVDGGGNFQSIHASLACIDAQAYDAAGSTTPPRGLFHIFQRVNFYRSPGFGIFANGVIHIRDCLFQGGGQPDLAVGGVHVDNIGGGQHAYLLVTDSVYYNSSGNFIDIAVPEAGNSSTVVFMRNRSIDHQVGGVYALGNQSIIAYNTLQNTEINASVPSGIGYDSTTDTSNRAYNLVTGNILTNITVVGGASWASYYDKVYGNIGSLALTENTGSASITAGTSVTFAHGLAAAPTCVWASFNATGYGGWTWTANATHAVVYVGTSGNYTVYWGAEAIP